MGRKTLTARLDVFMNTWIPNPAARLELVRLVEECHQQPRADHSDYPLLEWIDEQKRGLRSIGIS